MNRFDELKRDLSNSARYLTVGELNEWAAITVTVIQNTEESWRQDGKAIIDAASNISPDNPRLAVQIHFGDKATEGLDAEQPLEAADSNDPAKHDAPPTDITLNLQYFFPYCDQALGHYSGLRIILAVICSNQQDQQRVMCYLSALNRINPRLYIATGISKGKSSLKNVKLIPADYNAEHIGALFPLLRVNSEITEKDPYNTSDDSLTVQKLSDYTNVFDKYIADRGKSGLPDQPLNIQRHILLKAGCAAIDHINAFFYGTIPKSIKDLQNDIQKLERELAVPSKPSQENESTSKLLEKKRASLERASSKLNERKDYIAAFWDAVNKPSNGKSRLTRLPLLTQVIWLCSLYHLLDQDVLFDNNTHTLQRSQVDLVLWNSVTYSEGILQLLENCTLHSQHHCGYLSIYFHRIGLNRVSEISLSAERRRRIFYKYRVNLHDAFEGLSESVYIEFNITDMGRDKNYHAQGIEICAKKTLLELFSGVESFGKKGDLERVAHHYGMPLFYRTVLLNRGRFVCSTPSDSNGPGKTATAVQLIGRRLTVQKDEDKYDVLNSSQAWTNYQILLPLAPCPPEQSVNFQCGDEFLDSSYLLGSQMPSQYSCRLIEIDRAIGECTQAYSAEEKIDQAHTICKNLKKTISVPAMNNSVFTLRMIGMSSLGLELYLKGLFLFIAENETEWQAKGQEKAQPAKLLLRLLFSDEYALSEAVRRFSIFYDRNGENSWMAHTQVAFCSAESEYFPIRLILAGTNIQVAHITAKQYMQYNVDIRSGFLLSQIGYLTSCRSEMRAANVKPQPLFPFDLVAFEPNASNPKQLFLAGSDFGRKIMKTLETDLESNNCGCKIQDAHVRLGSKIHIKDFYDAELLFQSMANIYRFAYLLAEQIIPRIQNLDAHPPLYLIGYENYSSILVEEVIRLLKKTLPKHTGGIYHFQYIRGNDSTEKIIAFDHHEPLLSESGMMITILPIGTTLSTIYKIKNAFFRKYETKIPVNLQYNLSLILVGNSCSNGSNDDIAAMFWESIQDYIVKLTPENLSELDPSATQELEHQPTFVRWFFKVETQWMLPEQCSLCSGQSTNEETDTFKALLKALPLTQADKTSTIPKVIFPLTNSSTNHGIGFSISSPAENEKRLKQMQTCIEYGHIQRDTNHYQFYIDYRRYYEKVREDCIKWFKEIQPQIDCNAFNIVISPLQYDNCRFIKDALDHLFLHSLRFIYISLRQAYREEIRSRFSYIAKECCDACDGTAPPQFNVYYIDYSIVSGESMRRSESFVKMLFHDAPSSAQINIFKKVILLTNRSSFDTAATFVHDPKTDFQAYSTLCIPSYNTSGNRCPACEMVETYQTIAKCSATNTLFWHYHDLVQKHKLKTLEEHCRSLKEYHFSKAGYLPCFYQSLTVGLDIDPKESSDHYHPNEKIDYSKVKAAFEQGFRNLTRFRASPQEYTLGDIVNESNDKAVIIAYYKSLIAGRNWRRLICTHEAVSLAEQLEELSDQTQLPYDVAVRSKMWNIIVKRLKDIESNSGAEKANVRFVQREWLISYIKAFSREYPAKIAPIRNASYTLLGILFENLISQDDFPHDLYAQALDKGCDISIITDLLYIKDNDHPTDIIAAERVQLYQLYLVLGKRLCDLQSPLLLQYGTLEKVESFWVKLRGAQPVSPSSPFNVLLELPDDDRLRFDYLYMVKWATMSSNEEAKAFLLQELTSRLLSTSSDNEECVNKNEAHPLISRRFGEVLRQENTRILYTGIKRLDEIVGLPDQEYYNWKFLMTEVKNAMSAFGWIYNNSEDPSTQEIALLDHGDRNKLNASSQLLSQNPLHDLLKFLQADLPLPVPRFYVEEILAALLGFYNLMKTLEQRSKRENEKDYINIYGQLCFFLGKLGNYDNCCLIHKTNGENVILAQHLTQHIDDLPKSIQKILTFCCDAQQTVEEALYNTVVNYSLPNDPISALVLALRIKQGPDVTYHQSVYAVLFNVKTDEKDTDKDKDKEQGLSEPQMDRSHYLLFMRQRFQSFLERDLYALHHFKLSRDDVHPLTSKGTKTQLCILHLSDLHISKGNEKSIQSLITSQKDELKANSPDLLVVTGDVVQGTGSAIDLEENYKSASHILHEIAKLLWTYKDPSNGQESLRGDWRKRIIIIPGNHDYSSMNELVASSTLRATTLGTPTQRNGTPMSKYAYYIQFLQDFLDIDSRQSIQNNLNAVIEYPSDGFRLRFIALNSVAEVGPLRNNKVQLDKDFIRSLPALSPADDFLNICLSHHTWCYTPNYFADRYYTAGLTQPAIKLAEEIILLCKRGRDKLSRKGVDRASVRKEVDEKIGDKIKSSKSEFDCLSCVVSDSELSQDILYLKEHWSEITNERCQHIIFDYIINRRMQKADLREYKERIQELMAPAAKNYPIAIMLGGHTHKAGCTVSINHGGMSSDILMGRYACAEGPRFYCKEEGILQYGRLLINRSGSKRTLEYQFVPGTSIVKLEPVFKK